MTEFHVHGVIFWNTDICEIRIRGNWEPLLLINTQLGAEMAYDLVKTSPMCRIMSLSGSLVLTHEVANRETFKSANNGTSGIGSKDSID